MPIEWLPVVPVIEPVVKPILSSLSLFGSGFKTRMGSADFSASADDEAVVN